MKKAHDIGTIIATLVLILFILFTIIFFFSNNSLKDNSSEQLNINRNIYNEQNNITNIEKIYDEVSTYTTKIYDKDDNRVYNIKKACEILDGHIVLAGEEFSFNNTLGEMGKKAGYKKALGFDSKGNKIKVFGGGICQISSTLYNATLIGNLEITERHAHSRRVYYVPKDKDATVFYGGYDFKFKNNTNANIMISAYTDGYTVTVALKRESIVEI